MSEENKSIYSDRVEESIESESKDMFDEVFEEDEEEKEARKKLAEKAEELKKIKEKQALKIEEKINEDKTEKKEEIEMIVLSGGSSSLPQFLETLAKEIGMEVVIANPFLNINLSQKLASLTKFAPTFSVAVGLAMREE